jgi:short-subunit dehydrogenase
MKYALITGATSGIGYESACIAAQKHINLALVGRNTSKLEQLKTEWEREYSINVKIITCDLSEANAVEYITETLNTAGFRPDVLINNAGFGLFGKFEDTDIRKETDMLQVNIVALTRLTKVIFRQMAEQGYGLILNLASVAGFMSGPLMSVYYASKAYVLSFSQALAEEAKGTGVGVTALCPGPTDSNFMNNAGLNSSMLFKSFGKLPSSREVAEFGFKSMEKKKTVAIHGTVNRLMIFFIRFLPRKMVTRMVHYVQRPTSP